MNGKVMVMHGGGYHPFGPCAAILEEFLSKTAAYEVVSTQDRGAFRKLSGFDAVVIYTQGGKLTPAQEKGLLEYVHNGGGVVGIHCAADSFVENEGYMEMIGTQFAGHGHMCDITVEHTDDYETILPRVPKSWSQFDEFYILKTRTTKRLRPFQYGWWEHDRKMLGYTRSYGKGRVLYTGLGHDEKAFRRPEFQALIHKAVRYAAGEKEKPARWGIVGYGPFFGMGKHHADFIKQTSGMQLAAVCEKDPQRLECAKQEQGEDLQYFLSTKDLIESGSCDGVTVIVPHNLHAPVTVPLLEAGLHAISEKPFAVTPQECDQMIDAAKASGVVLSVYHSRHWDADMWTIRELVQSGAIGDVFSIEHNMCGYGRPQQWWRANKAVSGGVMYDMGAHGFEKILQIVPDSEANRRATLFGNYFKKVWWDTTNEDYARAYVRFGSGLEALLTQSNICTAVKPQWAILGTQGSCVSQADGIELKQCVNGTVRTTLVPYAQGLSWLSYYWNFADHLLAGAPLIITPQVAKAAIQFIHGCETASKTNASIEITFER